MRTMQHASVALVFLALLCSFRTMGHGEIVTPDEAKLVAANWVRFITERDGTWGGAQNAVLLAVKEFRRGPMLLGYYVGVKPQGYVIVSALKELAPVKAYSATSTLHPDDEVGMCALLKDVMERKLKLLIAEFGGLDSARLQGYRARTPASTRAVWTHLLAGGISLRANLQAVHPDAAGPVGPLLETTWDQNWPYNKLAPGGAGCSHTYAGCVAIAMAQVLRYYCWPPYGEGNHSYDWDDDDSCPDKLIYGEELSADFSDVYDWVHMPSGTTSTTAQEDAVAELCYEAGVSVDMDYGCCSSGAYMDDVRDALVDHFRYCEASNYVSRGDRWSEMVWYSSIVKEIDNHRPVIYRIQGGDDFNHLIVVDGYDYTGGEDLVHANYGWNDGHTAWYSIDYLDCDNSSGWQGGCDPDEEKMILYLYPKDALWGSWSGIVLTEGYSYVCGDLSTSDITIPTGALIQFLGGTKGTRITCSGASIEFSGSQAKPTQLFSRGNLSRGMKLTGGQVRMLPTGSVTVH
jgi:hypothetical protein